MGTLPAGRRFTPHNTASAPAARPPIRFPLAVAGLVLALLAAMAAAVAFGSVPLDLADALTDATARMIVLDLRLPRVLLAATVGAGLGAAGAAFQAVFRNPLADPFVVGSSSGGAVGVVVVFITGWAGVGRGHRAGGGRGVRRQRAGGAACVRHRRGGKAAGGIAAPRRGHREHAARRGRLAAASLFRRDGAGGRLPHGRVEQQRVVRTHPGRPAHPRRHTGTISARPAARRPPAPATPAPVRSACRSA